jgi:hypothetical protein
MKTRARLALSVTIVFLSAGAAGRQTGSAAGQALTGPLAALDVLTGTWTAKGSGFNTTLRYRWLLDGRVLEAANEVSGGDGRVLARYRGMYAWDAGRKEIVFWTAAESGEVHRGRAWWADGVLWHEADVSGGRIEAYASAVRPTDGRLEYFAAYGSKRAGPELLETKPLVYVRGESGGERMERLETR